MYNDMDFTAFEALNNDYLDFWEMDETPTPNETEGIKAEILDAIGCENAEVLLSKIDNYRQVANYSNWY